MVHKHHIIPKYEGGSDDSSNIVELTPKQHAMWHFAEWQRKGNWEDFCAFKMILGDVNSPGWRNAMATWAGKKGAEALLKKYPPGSDYWIQVGVKGNKAQRERLAEEGRTIAEKKWLVISPDGDTFEISNMALFCRERGLCKAHMGGVAAGSRKHHKGWKAVKLG
jgi:hypothetical protein